MAPAASVGPFAYLRPGAQLGPRGKIGTFVEVKNAESGAGSKVPHLTYGGDATIGEQSNIGAASVFVNYDGVRKHRTVIGSHVRVTTPGAARRYTVVGIARFGTVKSLGTATAAVFDLRAAQSLMEDILRAAGADDFMPRSPVPRSSRSGRRPAPGSPLRRARLSSRRRSDARASPRERGRCPPRRSG